LKVTLALQPADETQRTVQREIINDLHRALEARRQRIVVSNSSVSSVKWAAILLQALCALIAIAMVHSDNKLTCTIALAIFATGVAVSVLLIAAYSRPFTGEISVRPELLQRVMAPEPAAGPSTSP
jgi:positive regulator of sigma E activity